VFTYGPLGFLTVPAPFLGPSTILATAATAAIYITVATLLVGLAWRVVPLWVAVVIAFIVSRAFFPVLEPAEALQAVVFVVCVEAILSERADSMSGGLRDAAIVGAGALAAMGLLGKTNVGVFSAAMLLVVSVSLGRPWWRGAIAFAGSAVVVGLVLYLVAGQSPSSVPGFVAGTLDVVLGFSEAMQAETPPASSWVYVAFPAVLAILALLGWRATRGRSRPTLIALLVLGCVLAFAEWKTAFTRNGVGYAFATGLVALFALASRLPRGIRARRPIVALAFVAVFVFAFAAAHVQPLKVLDVRQSIRSVGGTALAFLPSNQAAALERTRTQLRDELGLPQDAVSALQGQRVHVEQWETSVLAAYPAFAWAPLPAFQAYSAYTTSLDELNAARLRSGDGPTRILRELATDPDGTPHAVDGRFPWFEEPAATLEMLCRYREVLAGARWQVLERTTATCGPATSYATITARAGQRVTVPVSPDPEAFTLVRITGFPNGPLDRLRALLFRAEVWYVELGDRGRFRLVPGTADDGLVLAVPSGVSSDPRFGFGPPIPSLTVTAGADGLASDAPLTFEFLTVPLRPGTP
jgi:hypothetical protein